MSEPIHYSCSDVVPYDGQEAIVVLREIDSINDPGSTKRRIWGPCSVKVTRWPDGGIDIEFIKEDE